MYIHKKAEENMNTSTHKKGYQKHTPQNVQHTEMFATQSMFRRFCVAERESIILMTLEQHIFYAFLNANETPINMLVSAKETEHSTRFHFNK